MRRRAANFVCSCVRAYQMARVGRPPVCRYLPSCSNYAIEAVSVHGVLRGSWLAARRLARCHPWRPVRCDPVPLSGPAHALREAGDV